ncbi:AEC family transporter [Aquicoccus sp. SCR17]|nr:AEC family transporter [Carideicomes alvinocaridis]
MFDVFLKTLPFFAIIGLGYGAARARLFPEEATGWLTRFVFYFALSAMLFRFAAELSLREVFDGRLVLAYLCASLTLYAVAGAVALARRRPLEEAAVEAQCAVSGNTGFLGVPMLTLLLGPAAIGPVMMVLAVDMIVFGSLIVILITGSRDGRMSPRILATVGSGLIRNPMILSISLGFLWAWTGRDLPGPALEFLSLLGAAATPGALFAIGASLASKSAERMGVAGWLSAAKLALHPALVALAALAFGVAAYPAGVMIAAAALPVAGNVFMLAQHYGVAPQRVSASILVSTAFSILTLPAIIAWVGG